uniref:Portal protein n=1 Tax=viral metagenome TaxID=1070528 RepID=A0A6M3J4D6_9ZZZZ
MASFDNIGEIRNAIKSFRNDTTFLAMKSRWEKDFSLYRLKQYDAGTGYYSYTSNSPRVYADKIIALLVGSKLIVRVPLETLTDPEREIASNIERFSYGVMRINDERLSMIPDMPNLRQMMSWYACLRGAFAIKAHIYKNEKGETIPSIDIWDIYSTAYGEKEDGLAWAARTHKITKKRAKEAYGVDVGSNTVEIYEYYDEDNYGVFIGDKWVVDRQPHNVGYCPVSIIRVGSTPPMWQDDYSETTAHIGESVFSANRWIYPLLNKTLSDHLTLVRRGVKTPLASYTHDGQPAVEQDIYQVEKGGIISLRTGEKIEPILQPTMPADTGALVNIIFGEIQRGGLSHTTYGELGFRLSGFAINQLQQSIQSVLEPCLTAVEKAYERASMWMLGQYAGSNFPPMKIRGRTSRGEAFGFPKAVYINPSDIPGDWAPEFKLDPILPQDDAQRYQLAGMAGQGDIPLLSRQSRREMVGVQDPDLEEEKVNQEWAVSLAIPRLYEAYLAALNDERPDKAENIRAELRRLLGQLGAPNQAPGAPQGQPGTNLSPLEQAALENEGVGAPSGKTGLPSSTYPSEMSGGMPGGALNAKLPAEGEEV